MVWYMSLATGEIVDDYETARSLLWNEGESIAVFKFGALCEIWCGEDFDIDTVRSTLFC